MQRGVLGRVAGRSGLVPPLLCHFGSGPLPLSGPQGQTRCPEFPSLTLRPVVIPAILMEWLFCVKHPPRLWGRIGGNTEKFLTQGSLHSGLQTRLWSDGFGVTEFQAPSWESVRT